MPRPGFNFLDDKSNPIVKKINQQMLSEAENANHFGNSKSTDAEGKKYPKGFTPPVDYLTSKDESQLGDKVIINEDAKFKTNGDGLLLVNSISPDEYYINPDDINDETGLPKEYGDSINTNNKIFRTTNEKLLKDKKSYNGYKDFSGAKFKHLLDYYNAGERRLPEEGQDISNIYLSSFVSTLNDNEDPTILGYDLELKVNSSPLFNGELRKFFEVYGEYDSELKSRIAILDKFQVQFFKFFKRERQVYGNTEGFSIINGPKVYYMKNISGLDKLIDNDKQSFIKYGEDLIKLTFNEDVDQNFAYLASLYKSLYYSRIRGKIMAPENLFRFDIDITITEIRKYNRAFKNEKSIIEYSDLLSKTRYTLYECQFFFNNMPHSDTIDMSATKAVDSVELQFNYKFSTMLFTKFTYNGTPNPTTNIIIDNRKIEPERSSSNTTNRNFIQDNRIISEVDISDLIPISIQEDGNPNMDELNAEASSISNRNISQIDALKAAENSKKAAKAVSNASKEKKEPLGKNKAFNKFQKDLENAFRLEANRQMIRQAGLLNKTLESIRNMIPGAGRMSEPTNVYSKYNNPFTNDLINSARNFVGNSIKGFFQK